LAVGVKRRLIEKMPIEIPKTSKKNKIDQFQWTCAWIYDISFGETCWWTCGEFDYCLSWTTNLSNYCFISKIT
jgi:hypothetical protein